MFGFAGHNDEQTEDKNLDIMQFLTEKFGSFDARFDKLEGRVNSLAQQNNQERFSLAVEEEHNQKSNDRVVNLCGSYKTKSLINNSNKDDGKSTFSRRSLARAGENQLSRLRIETGRRLIIVICRHILILITLNWSEQQSEVLTSSSKRSSFSSRSIRSRSILALRSRKASFTSCWPRQEMKDTTVKRPTFIRIIWKILADL